FADQGAEVIKIEDREFPDLMRVAHGRTMTPNIATACRNKKSFGVSLRSPEGAEVFRRLVAQSDAVIENFKPGTLEKLNLGYESLHGVTPALVMLSTNGFGSRGRWSAWAGSGPILRAASGLTSLWRYADDESGFGEPNSAHPDHYGARVCAAALLGA